MVPSGVALPPPPGGPKSQAGLDLVAFSRAEELTDLAIFDDVEITRQSLMLQVGKGPKYDDIPKSQAGLDLVVFSRVEDLTDLAISDDVEIPG